MANYSYVVSPKSIIFTYNSLVYNIDRASSSGIKLKEILDRHRKGGQLDIDEVMNIITDKAIYNYITQKQDITGIVINDDMVTLDGEPLSDELAEIIKKHYVNNVDFSYLVRFIEKMRSNPSYSIREQLYKFIHQSEQCGGFTIDRDGDIIAYKLVTNDFKDIYTKTFDNSPGSIVRMPRELVDDNPFHTCSEGLHFCAYSYLKHYQNESDCRVVLIKVNPKDVVSIPVDYNNAKARCCEYKVVCEVNNPVKDIIFDCERESKEDDIW